MWWMLGVYVPLFYLAFPPAASQFICGTYLCVRVCCITLFMRLRICQCVWYVRGLACFWNDLKLDEWIYDDDEDDNNKKYADKNTTKGNRKEHSFFCLARKASTKMIIHSTEHPHKESFFAATAAATRMYPSNLVHTTLFVQTPHMCRVTPYHMAMCCCYAFFLLLLFWASRMEHGTRLHPPATRMVINMSIETRKSRKMFSAQINYDLFYVNMVNELSKILFTSRSLSCFLASRWRDFIFSLSAPCRLPLLNVIAPICVHVSA